MTEKKTVHREEVADGKHTAFSREMTELETRTQ
jgi:hypothetical protein